MANKTLTTANSALALSVRGLFPVPQSIQGYATDDSFAVDDVSPVEVQMGVDGKLSAGYVPYPTVLNIMLQADSASTAMFDTVLDAQKAAKEAFIFDGTLIIQGTGEKYAFTNGFLTTVTPMSTAKKVLQPRKFALTFELQTKSPV
jgi:hypothetical protein